MRNRRLFLFGFFCLAALLATGTLPADEPAATTISIEGMHCAGCAKKVASRLQTVTSVATAQADAPKPIAVITSKSNTAPSSWALWEAVERAGYKPVKLVGPSGIFTGKPKL